MDNKKYLIITLVVVITAILFGTLKIATTYFFTEDLKVPDGHNHLIEIIKNTTDEQERRNSIDHAIEYNLITQEEANSLY